MTKSHDYLKSLDTQQLNRTPNLFATLLHHFNSNFKILKVTIKYGHHKTSQKIIDHKGEINKLQCIMKMNYQNQQKEFQLNFV